MNTDISYNMLYIYNKKKLNGNANKTSSGRINYIKLNTFIKEKKLKRDFILYKNLENNIPNNIYPILYISNINLQYIYTFIRLEFVNSFYKIFEYTTLKNLNINNFNVNTLNISKNTTQVTQFTRKMYIFGMLLNIIWLSTQSKQTIQQEKIEININNTFPSNAEINGSFDGFNFDSIRPSTSFTPIETLYWYIYGLSEVLKLMTDDYTTKNSNYLTTGYGGLIKRTMNFLGYIDKTTPIFTKKDSIDTFQNEIENTFISNSIPILNKKGWSYVFDKINKWLHLKSNDGSESITAGHYILNSTDEPSIDPPLDIANIDDNPNPTFNSSTDIIKWKPIKIGLENIQSYLGYKWNDVKSPCITDIEKNIIDISASNYYPTIQDRTQEINDIVYQNLDDTNKIIAEFFAGGNFTVMPPGQNLWMYTNLILRHIPNYFGDSPSSSIYNQDSQIYLSTPGEMNAQSLILLDLVTNMFETGLLVWRLKRKFMQARPVHEVRVRYHNQIIPSWQSEESYILGNEWLPYQPFNFISPPFADFPSGHSGFSKSFANVMNKWFGPNIPRDELPIRYFQHRQNHLSILTPLYSKQGIDNSFLETEYCKFIIPEHSSEIQSNVPNEPVTLQFDTWDDYANMCGISRIYGGIHAITAHTGSVLVSNQIFSKVNSRLNITKLYNII
jgi:hypothetical protein